MSRQARKHSGTGIYHVMLRGINRQDIFEDDEDYTMFVRILSGLNSRPSGESAAPLFVCHIFAYCLMSNHVHLLVREKDWPLGAIVKSIASSYVFYFNKKYGRVGHLFQDRFKSEPCDDMSYFFTLFRYIHQNPLKAGLVKNVSDYRFSSWSCDYLGCSPIKVCHVRPVLRRVDLSRLHELVDTPLPDGLACIDIENEKFAVADEEVRNMLLKMSGVNSITAFQRLDKTLQKGIVAEVMCRLKAGPRQMSRVSGLSYSVIQRIGGSGGSWGQEY